MTRKLSALLLTCAMVFSFALCSIAAEAADENTPQSGGTFIIAVDEDPKNFLSATSGATAVNVAATPLWPGLLAYDENMNILTTELAESYEFVDDKVLTFHLRENAGWTDGTPITSKDVKFTIENFTTKGPFKIFLQNLESVETPDDYTVVITLNAPFSNLPYYFHWHYCPILPAHVWADYVDNYQECSEFAFPTVTGGAWKLDEYVSGDHVTYVPNEYFWKEGQPYLSKLILKIIPDVNTQVAALEAGEVDYVLPHKMPASEAERLSKNPDLTVTTKGFELRAVPRIIHFNTQNEFLSNVLVRRALATATNLQAIIDNTMAGYGEILDSTIPKGVAWDDIRITPEYVYNYDVDAANALLDEAGYPMDENGSRGISLEYVVRNSGNLVKIGEMLKSFYDAVGVELIIKTVESAAYNDIVFVQGDYAMTCQDSGIAKDYFIEGRFYRTDFIGAQGGNIARYSNERIDEIFKTVANSTPEEQKAMYAELQETIAADCLNMQIQSVAPYAFRNCFGGLPVHPQCQLSSWDGVWYIGE